MLAVTIALYVLCPVLIYFAFVNGTTSSSGSAVPQWPLFIAGCVVLGIAILLSPGFFTLQPNEARVLILFGDYKGRCARAGSIGAIRSTPTAPRARAAAPVAVGTGQAARERGAGQAGDAPIAPEQGFAARAQPQRRPTQGQRQAGQPDRDRRGRRLAGARTPPRPCSTWTTTRTTCASRASRRCGTWPALRLRPRGGRDEITLRSGVDEVSEALRKELQERLAKAGVRWRRRG